MRPEVYRVHVCLASITLFPLLSLHSLNAAQATWALYSRCPICSGWPRRTFLSIFPVLSISARKTWLSLLSL